MKMVHVRAGLESVHRTHRGQREAVVRPREVVLEGSQREAEVLGMETHRFPVPKVMIELKFCIFFVPNSIVVELKNKKLIIV